MSAMAKADPTPAKARGADVGMVVRTAADADALMARIRAAAAQACGWAATAAGEPLEILRRMKFEPIGFHPTDGRPLNLVEQINQTWTFAVAVAAARLLLDRHPEAGGFRLAPGAHASQELDVMSVAPGLVGAETFAAVCPTNNRKLAKDLAKLASRPEEHRYVFFLSPRHRGTARLPRLERAGVQVWCVDV